MRTSALPVDAANCTRAQLGGQPPPRYVLGVWLIDIIPAIADARHALMVGRAKNKGTGFS
jgi:hypothetical protein